jgi:hypothetical protein
MDENLCTWVVNLKIHVTNVTSPLPAKSYVGIFCTPIAAILGSIKLHNFYFLTKNKTHKHIYFAHQMVTTRILSICTTESVLCATDQIHAVTCSCFVIGPDERDPWQLPFFMDNRNDLDAKSAIF